MTWHAQAACIGRTELFFAESGQQAKSLNPQACAICATCPVRTDCLEAALADSTTQGVWAGTTFSQRRRIRAERGHKYRRALVASCGTNAGYVRHRRDGTPACAQCINAARDYKATRRWLAREMAALEATA